MEYLTCSKCAILHAVTVSCLNLKANLNLEEDSAGIIRLFSLFELPWFSRLKNSKIHLDTKAPVMLDHGGIKVYYILV